MDGFLRALRTWPSTWLVSALRLLRLRLHWHLRLRVPWRVLVIVLSPYSFSSLFNLKLELPRLLGSGHEVPVICRVFPSLISLHLFSCLGPGQLVLRRPDPPFFFLRLIRMSMKSGKVDLQIHFPAPNCISTISTST